MQQQLIGLIVPPFLAASPATGLARSFYDVVKSNLTFITYILVLVPLKRGLDDGIATATAPSPVDDKEDHSACIVLDVANVIAPVPALGQQLVGDLVLLDMKPLLC